METYNTKYSKWGFWPSIDNIDLVFPTSLLSTTMNSESEVRDNQMRTLAGYKEKVSWSETLGLEEQHSSMVPRVFSPKRRSLPDQVLPSSQPSGKRKPREVDSFPDGMGVSLATSDKFDTSSKGN